MECHHTDAERFAGVFLGLAAPHHVIRQAKHCGNFLQIVSLHLLLARTAILVDQCRPGRSDGRRPYLCRKNHPMVTWHLMLSFYYKQLSTMQQATAED
jgi:hypothetical protein